MRPHRSRSWVLHRAPVRENLARIKPGQTAEVRLNAYPEAVFVGTVETVGKQLDASARTVVTRIAITNKDDLLKVGLFGKARVSL